MKWKYYVRHNLPVITSWNRINISIHVQPERLFLQDHCLSSWLQSSFWKQLPSPSAVGSPLMLPKYPCLTSWNRQHPGMCNNLSSSSAKAFSHKFFLYRILCLVVEPDYLSWDPQHRFPLQFLSADIISGKGTREISLTWTLQNNISLLLEARLWGQILG